MCSHHNHRCPIRFRRSGVYLLPSHGPREIMQTRPSHAHERPSLPTQIRSTQIHRRRSRNHRHHILHVFREREEGPQELWGTEQGRRGWVGTAYRDGIPLGESVTGRSREQHPGSDLPNLQTDRAADDVTHQLILHLDLDSAERFTVTTYPGHPPHRCGRARADVRHRVSKDSPGSFEGFGPIRHHRRVGTTIYLRDTTTFRFLNPRVRTRSLTLYPHLPLQISH